MKKSIVKLIVQANQIVLNPNLDWEQLYDQIFDMWIWKKIHAAGYAFDWSDPDTSYEEDVLAYVRALNEWLEEHL